MLKKTNKKQVHEEIKQEIRKYLETKENGNTELQNLWNAAKAVLRGKFIAIKSYLKKQEKHRIDNLTLHLKQLKKRRIRTTKKSNISRRKEILKI